MTATVTHDVLRDAPPVVCALMFTLALGAVGCGAKDASLKDRLAVHPAHGRVLVDGRPAAGAVVSLFPVNVAAGGPVRPLATAGPDGTFRMTTYSTGDGAPAGEYTVTVVWPAPVDTSVDEPAGAPDQLRGRYGDPRRSILRVVVKEGDNQLPPFELRTR
jgi:hypothetical protein